ncbi:class I SAM-dependent methyltransferase [Candidatus Parcubacteria bacterium]|nr:class I SAM-dependent methyltransferase [Candidatus Parcubacteria bacterium]
MSFLRRLYTKGKGIPVVGPLLRFGRTLYRYPIFEAHRLLVRDRQSAHDVLTLLYGVESPAHRYLERFIALPAFTRSFSVGHSGDFDAMMLYTLVRMQKPEVVVETGVASGRSSATILSALAENGKGRLYSIDLPKFYTGEAPVHFTTEEGNQELRGFVPKGKQPGWLIPDALRSRWELILGDSNAELPKLFARLPTVDMFYHDGDHSYGTMRFEFDEVWKRLSPGGLLLSDDIDWNSAWKEFVAKEHPHSDYSYRHFGIARKTISV